MFLRHSGLMILLGNYYRFDNSLLDDVHINILQALRIYIILFPNKTVLMQQMQLYAWGTILSFLFQILLWKKMGVLFYFPPNSSKTCAHVQCILFMSFVRDRSKGEWIFGPEMDHHWLFHLKWGFGRWHSRKHSPIDLRELHVQSFWNVITEKEYPKIQSWYL